jgi:DNA-binding transcriptional MerR regulator
MEQSKFLLSDIAAELCVSEQLLKQWEVELSLHIGQAEDRERYYTPDDMQLFRCIKKLKDEGVQTESLKRMIPKLRAIRQQLVQQFTNIPVTTPAVRPESEVFYDTQLDQVRNLIGGVLSEVVRANNEQLKQEISETVTENVLQEMHTLFHRKEEQDEAHFRKLDALIRQQQSLRKEAANNQAPLRRLKKIFT